MDSGEIVVSSIRAGMKREFAMMMKAQSEMGGLPAGGRRMTRSQSTVGSSKGYVRSADKVSRKVKGSESKKIKKDEGEKLGGEGVRRLEFDVLDCDKGENRDAPQVLSNVGDDSGGLKADLVAVERREAEKVGAELREDMPLVIESPVPQVRGTDGDSIHEDEKPVGETTDLGYERTEESTSGLSEKPFRRFTHSALKLQDEEMGLGSTAGVVDSGGAVTLTTSPSKLEMKMSKKVELNRIPTKLKDLLETGLLEGLHVRYIHGSKWRRRPESELRGVIQGAGILCSCDECKERKIVTPNQFEMHAGSGNKRPPEYIFLENGKSLRDVLNACKANLSESLESVILNAIGRSNYTTAFCIHCKELIPEAGAGRSMLLCDSCVLPKESDASDAQISDTSCRSLLAGPSAPASSSCPPVVPESAQISSDSQPQTKRQGKLTRKDLRMHKSVLAEDVLPEGTALSYVMHGEKRLEGYKKDGGIFCMCCREVVSPSQFEAHAGFASRRKPYMSIYTSNGVSLHQLSLELSKNRKSSTEENDDLCSICEDGGDLLCCENCPRAFHTECVGLSVIPQGIWGHDFSKSGFTARTVIICDQCEKEYHVGCLKERNIDDLKALPEGEWFCCRPCSNINSTLQKLIGDGDQRLPEALSDVLKKKCEGQDPQKNPELEIRWRLLRGKKATEDTRVWLSGAVTIFHDRFDPIADASTGRLDLIPHMVYGRHFKDQDFCGMYCAVLMVNSVVVSAGIFRIFGDEVAELPLVATRSECQGKGYFQSLFYCIEGLLASLNVKDLVLPAADEAESLWKNRFGFEKLGQEQVHMANCFKNLINGIDIAIY
ncbi:UNVERIFIED_CONTAM: Increased DNA methylation 1 [Sesamum latifolium]|uniref:Increased DNA methylation 1 n=1 Tax=Sesamum latifolium TaxID=2727402 RepID=A0AAW2Y4D5_9LAMI